MQIAPTPSVRMIVLAISVIVATEGLVPISTSVSYLPTIAIRMRLAPIPQVHILVRARRDSSATASLAMSLTSACTAMIVMPMRHALTLTVHTIACV